MPLRFIADGVWQLTGYPPYAVNCYLVGDVLIDAATRWARRRILCDLRHRVIRMVALTHCHPDHQGLAKLICEQRKIPLACHEADTPAMEGRIPMQPDNGIIRFGNHIWSGPPHPVARVLRQDDEVADFRVIHAPGHTPGHIIYFRDSDRLAIAGDLLCNFHPLKMEAELTEPLWFFSADPAENRRSIMKLAKLNPRTVCFGHGPPLRDARKLQAYVASW